MLKETLKSFKKLRKYTSAAVIIALFCLLSGIGLQLQALGSNVVANPSVETVDPTNVNLPSGWIKDNWGTNTATLSYTTDAHTGSRGLSVNITKRTNGDAKWYFSPVSVKPSTLTPLVITRKPTSAPRLWPCTPARLVLSPTLTWLAASRPTAPGSRKVSRSRRRPT
jgi:hypothetical protein